MRQGASAAIFLLLVLCVTWVERTRMIWGGGVGSTSSKFCPGAGAFAAKTSIPLPLLAYTSSSLQLR